jgi:hypothetical protein
LKFAVGRLVKTASSLDHLASQKKAEKKTIDSVACFIGSILYKVKITMF